MRLVSTQQRPRADHRSGLGDEHPNEKEMTEWWKEEEDNVPPDKTMAASRQALDMGDVPHAREEKAVPPNNASASGDEACWNI